MEGRLLGAYRIGRELGSGGMGRVFLAETAAEVAGLPPGACVAVKLVHPHLLGAPGFFKRFLREAEIGQAVRHENVVRTLDADALALGATQHHFLVMEYVEGQTLAALREELGAVPEELCLHVAREVAQGLAAIHAAGAVHRDLKPANVLITPDHRVKVMDLGVARLKDEALRLSQTGAFVGSMRYAAPEQFRGDEVDGRADLYALGVTLYELAAGRHPFAEGEAASMMWQHLEVVPPSLAEAAPAVSPFFAEAVATLLAKDPGARFPSAEALLAALREGEGGGWWRTRAAAPTARPERRLRVSRETAVFGREEEIEGLLAAWRAAVSGEGRAVLLTGEAGIGKTRLADELIARLRAGGDDPAFLFGGFPPGGAATALGAFCEAFRGHLGEAALAGDVVELLPAAPALAPAFAALLRGEPPPGGRAPLPRESVQAVFLAALRGVAAEGPAVLLVDDLHFAPAEGRALFAALATAVASERVLLLGTSRPGLPEDWLAGLDRLPQFSRLDLPRLGARDLNALLVSAFGSEEPAQELAYEIAARSDGNPYFVFEILRALREGRLIEQREDGTWATTRVIRRIRIPDSVRELIRARIAELAAEERDLLDVAACCGYGFDPLLVAAAAGLARIPALKTLAQVERRHRLVRADGRRYRFDHHEVREALYESMSELLREPYHEALAEALLARSPEPSGEDAVEAARHLLLAGEGGRALPLLPAALERLAATARHEAAVDLLGRALAAKGLLEGAGRRAHLVRQAGFLDLLGRREEEREALETALALAPGPAEAAPIRRLLGIHRIRVARYDEAVEALDRALAEAREAGDRATEARALGNLGLARQARGEHEAAVVLDRRSIELCRAVGDRRSEAHALGNLGITLSALGRFTEARECHERHLAAAREIGDGVGETAAVGNLGVVLGSLGRHAEAEARFAEQHRLARDRGDRRSEAIAVGNLGIACASQGRLEEACGHYRQQLRLARETGDRRGESNATGNLALALEALGRYGEARELLLRNLELAREIGGRTPEAVAEGNVGALLSLAGRHAEAREHVERSLAISREIGYRRGEGYALHGLGRIAAREGDPEAADRLFREALAVRREIGYPGGVAATLLALGELAEEEGRAGEAAARYEEAAAAAEEIDATETAALARIRRAALPDGNPTEAWASFERAGASLGHQERMEARWLLHRALGDPVHLREARRLLDELLAGLPAEDRAGAVERVPLHRRIRQDRPFVSEEIGWVKR